ncbi:MAG TPA: hypothetical protein VHU42_18425 [Rhodopila sp.]|jgi:hypothetical protein|nr:hypothetical protein [Rhodopila sp.]
MTLTNLFGLAATLARPVCRGYMPEAVADASLLVSTLRAERAGTLAPYRAGEIVRLLRFFLRKRLDAEDLRHKILADRIRRSLTPLIARRARWGELMATAHDVNAAAGFPLAEETVSVVVEEEVWFALPAPPRGARHGG